MTFIFLAATAKARELKEMLENIGKADLKVNR
jgi:hypothetical protein